MLKKLLIIAWIPALLSAASVQDVQTDSLETKLSLASTDSERIETTFQLADHYALSDRPKSLRFLERSLAWARKQKNTGLEGRCLNKIGDFHWYSGDYPLASKYYYSALYLFGELHDKKEIAACYRNIGWIYLGQKNYNQSDHYFHKSLDLTKKVGSKKDLIPCYDDLGILYRTTGRYDEAIRCFQQTVFLGRQFGYDKAVAEGTANLAETYFDMNNYEAARITYLEAIALHEQLNDRYNLCAAYIGIGKCYLALKEGESAMTWLQKANRLAGDNKFVQPETESWKHLAQAAELLNNKELAYRYMNRYAALSDSLHDANEYRQMNEMSAKYESDREEAAIYSLHKQEKLMNARLEDEFRFTVFLLVFSGITLVLTFSFFRSYRDNKKANKRLSRVYAEIESKNKDISDSINYARQIQRARLPDHDFIMQLAPESFGLFKPKDVVSGDFYWFADLKDGKMAFAAADCTGHGIPGAFMSLIGIDTLHQAVIESGITCPSEILSFINVSLKKSLRQNDLTSHTRDGMDIALCVLDRDKMELHYAGAHRPLILIRNNEITEIKATSQAIGGLTANEQEFQQHTIALRPDDMIYVYTDGFADQFGGPQDKKYTTRKFKELLLSICTRSAKEQEKMLDIVFEAWRGKAEQIDDILVIGVRI